MEKKLFAVIAAEELLPGTMRCQMVAGRRILLAHTGGRFFAVDEMCSHEEWTLCNGALQGETVKCSLHGSRFDLNTGAPLDEPARQPIKTYPVELKDGVVYVGICAQS